MKNKFEYLSYRGDHGGHLAERFLKKYCPYPKLSQLLCRDLPSLLGNCVIISKQGFLTFKCL